MYEENRKCLASGDASVVFAEQLAELRQGAAMGRVSPLTPESVSRLADKRNQPAFAGICRRLLLPGSRIRGLENLRRLVELTGNRESCLLCLNHRSNLDVPTLYTLLEDMHEVDLFHRITWIAGRKLEEDDGITVLLIQCVNRVIVTPHSWFARPHSEEEVHRARVINIAAERAIAHLRREGQVFALFPAGTRIRSDDASTRQPIGETYGYLRAFDNLLHCNIDGCTMPVSRDRDFSHETPRLDRVIYTFGPVHRTGAWIAEAIAESPEMDERTAISDAMIRAIEALAPADALDRDAFASG